MIRIVLALMICMASAVAAPIPSSVSGVYSAPDRVCRVVFQRYQVDWVQLDLRCMVYATGTPTWSLTTLWAPGSYCPTGSIAWMVDPQAAPGAQGFVSFQSFGADSVDVVLGLLPTPVANGIGIEQTWTRLFAIDSPSPYSCGSSPRYRFFGR